MKKKLNLSKILLTCRVVFVMAFILSTCMSVQGMENSPELLQQKKVTLNIKEEPLSNVIQTIINQSGSEIVFFNSQTSNFKCRNIQLTSVSVDKALEEVLKGSGLTFRTQNGRYVIYNLPPTNQENGRRLDVKIVKGRVTDTSGEPLPAAAILIKGTRTGHVTDEDGNFSFILRNPEGAVLVFSFLGMKTKEIPYNDEETLNITLQEDASLSEIIVTGYQNISKHQVAGSIKQIKLEDIKSDAVFTVDQMLVGQVAGVNIVINSGEPSATPKIRIRGTSSILGNKAPIWVLDGIILSDPVSVNYQDLTGDDAAYLIGNAIAGVNPSDIETLTILKDASATALYGTQAANGVIVVTTKRGKAGPARISYNGSFSVNERPNYGRLDLMNASERITLSQEMLSDYFRYNRVPDDIGYEGLYLKYLNHNLSYSQFSDEINKMAIRNTDWYDLLFRDAVSHNHTISLGGGHERTRYYASVGYNNTPTTAINGGSERFSGSMKLDSWIKKRLYIALNLSGAVIKNRGFSSMAGVNPNSYAQKTARTIAAFDDNGEMFFYKKGSHSNIPASDGSVFSADRYFNILNEMNTTGARGEVSDFKTDFTLQYEFLKGLKYEVIGSMMHSNSKQFDFTTQDSYYVTGIRGWNPNNPYLIGNFSAQDWYQNSPIPNGGIQRATYTTRSTYMLRNKIQYATNFKNVHTISGFATYELRSIPTTGSSSVWYGWQPDRGQTISPVVTSGYINRLNQGLLNPILTDREPHYISWLGSASYSYKDKWTLNGNVRADGSNLFGSNPKYRFLPVWSVAAKYTITNESWLLNNPVLSYMAFRASYGVQGNVDPNTSPSLVIKIGAKNSVTGLDQSSVELLPNADLRWEKTKSYNLGLDFSLFKDLLTGTVDVYKKHGTDMIFSTQVSAVTGRTQLKINAGVIENSGIETAITLHPFKTKSWDFYINANYSYNLNKLVKGNNTVAYSRDSKIRGTALIEGKSIGTLYSYPFAGLNAQTGYPLFYDKDGKTSTMIGETDVQNYSLYEDEIELVESGLLTPPHHGGLDFTLRWKNLRLSTGFSYSLGAIGRLPGIYSESSFAYNAESNLRKEFIDRWRQQGDEIMTNIPVLYSFDTYLNGLTKRPLDTKRPTVHGYNMYDNSTIRTAKTDILRLQRLNLSYNLPRHALSRLGIESASIGIQATNLFFLVNKAWRGMDPESGYASVPMPRTYTMNIMLSF
jgi:TonB-linked SusC/RagA family outer membrane protein